MEEDEWLIHVGDERAALGDESLLEED